MTYAAVEYASGLYGGSGPASPTAGAMPDVSVEIAFASNPGDTTPAWVDVSTDEMLVEITRGRNQELDQYQAGQCTVTLLDTARKYDPSNAASPYSPNLKPMKRLRVRATYAGVTYPLFSGFIDSFDHEYAGPPSGMATATIRATDGFKVLEAIQLLNSAYATEITTSAPIAWWRLGDAQGTTARDTIAGISGTAVGATFGQSGLVSRDSDTAVTFTTTGGITVTDSRALLTGSVTAFSFEAVIQTAQAGTEVIMQQDGSDSAQFRLRMLGTGILEFQVSDAGLVYTAETESTGAVNDGSTHHVVATFSTTNGLRVYVDGVNVSNLVVTDTGTPVLVATQLTIGNDKALVVNGWEDTLDEVAVYNRELTAAEVAAHAGAVSTPWNGDTPAARLGRILDFAAWPANLREIDTGTSVLQSAELAMSVLEHAQKVAASDFGALFMAADGRVRFIGREQLFKTVNLATFGDDPTDATELGYRAIRPEFTDQLIRNDVTVSRNEGVAQRVEDATSITSFLRHSFVLDGLIHNSDTLSRSAAEFIVSEYKDPRRRISGLDTSPRGVPNQPGSRPEDLFPIVLAAELANELTVIDRPPGGGALNSQDSAIEGITHRIAPLGWETSWRLAPVFGSAGIGAVGIWDLSLWDQARWGF